jgi:4-diphosphocytidyl-2-C-methyl-D-erythritol kinase
MAQIWPAPAKLNLFLHITGQREDGYHTLQTIFQFVDLADELEFTLRKDGEIHRTSDLAGVPEDQDLVVRAARMLQQEGKCSLGVDIKVTKKLPMGGGLGGGSSDAATTLVALNSLWNLDLSEDMLLQLGLQLGADVPIFIHGQAVWAEGIGEQFSEVELPEPWYLILLPACEVSTAELFSDPRLTRDCHPITIRNFLSGQAKNVFEPLVRSRYPEVDRAMHWLSGFADAKLTGTGACVFAAFATRAKAEKAYAKCPDDIKAYVARGLNRSPLRDAAERT